MTFLIKHKKNIPNIITISRIFISIFVIVFYFIGIYNQKFFAYQIKFNLIGLQATLPTWIIVGGVLFLIGSWSDFFDGYLARKWKMVSDFGKFLDPIADKILINGVFIVLAVGNEIAIAWAVIIFILRDIIVDSIRMFCLTKNVIISAGIWGKWKTVFQMFGILFLSFVFFNSVNQYKSNNLWFYYLVQNGFVLLAVVFSLISLINYFNVFYRCIKVYEFKN